MLSPRTNPGNGSGPARYPGTFLLALRQALGGLNFQVRRWLGDAVECADPEGKTQVVGLENLFRRARRTPREDWPRLIAEFLQHAILADEGDDLPTDLNAIADKLLVRLGTPFPRGSHEVPLWSQKVAETELVVNLVVDYPSRMIYVTEEMVAASGKTGDEWLDLALENLVQRTPGNALEVIDAESGLLTCLTGDAYDSSRALLLDRLLADRKADGFFVGLPCRDQLLVLPVTAPSLVFVHLLKVLLDKNYKSLPYPISAQVYWVRCGVWHPFPIEVTGNKVSITPPAEFHEILDRLAPTEEEDDEPEGTAPEEAD